jgi:acyl CoA:acetate/3-ketoacid CoA transferase beta subunit
MIPGQLVKGMGGAMDLVAGAENIIVLITHASKAGESKLLPRCTLPLTGVGCVRRVLTDLAYLEIENSAFVLKERAPGVSVQYIKECTAGKLPILPRAALTPALRCTFTIRFLAAPYEYLVRLRSFQNKPPSGLDGAPAFCRARR